MKRIILRYRTFILYFIGGIISYLSRVLFNELFLLFTPIEISYIFALAITFIINYFFNRHVTFTENKRERAFIRYIFAYSFFMLLDYLVVMALSLLAGIYHIIAITISTGTIFIIKYFVYKKKVFSR